MIGVIPTIWMDIGVGPGPAWESGRRSNAVERSGPTQIRGLSDPIPHATNWATKGSGFPVIIAKKIEKKDPNFSIN